MRVVVAPVPCGCGCLCFVQAEQKTLAGILAAQPDKKEGILSSILHVLTKQAEKRLLSLTGTSQRLLGEYVKFAEPKVGPGCCCCWDSYCRQKENVHFLGTGILSHERD